MPTDLERAYSALSGKLLPYATLFAYADGDQPLIYSTERLREAFGNINARFSQNWCAVVINAALDRLGLSGWDTDDKTINDRLDDIWSRLDLALDGYDAHKAALVAGEGFLIAWKDQPAAPLDLYYNDPRYVHVFYRADRPKVKEFAAKWWSDASRWRMTLYYPDRLEYYVSTGRDLPSTASGFQPAEPDRAANPYGIIPVFHFRGPGELANIISLQDAVNKLFADMMVSAEFGAFKQRWIISNSDTTALKNNPMETWTIPAGDGQGQQSSVGQFDATPLDNYLSAVNEIANSIAIISRTPKHYFYAAGSNISGEALLAMEAPLTKKVEMYQARFAPVWRELGAFLLKLDGGGEVDRAAIRPVWKPAESVQPYTEAQTLQINVASGIPLVTQLRRQGWAQGEIEAMLADKKTEQKEAAKMAPLLLEQARNETAQQNDGTDEDEE